jgi:crotonobetaine/carnitine-CoA ligase
MAANTPQRDFYDGRIPNRDRCVARYLIDRWASVKPDETYVLFEDGRTWSYAELRRRVLTKAAGLQGLGVARGDHVVVWLPSGPDVLLAFYAVTYLGAVFVPINTAYRGGILAHVLANAGARIAILHPDLLVRLTEIDPVAATRLVLTTSIAAPDIGVPTTRFDAIDGDPETLVPLDAPIEPWDLQSIIYTSGTTGPSKGVLSCYLHMYSNAGPESWPMVTERDRYLVASPFFHIGGMGAAFVMLVRGGSIALLENYTTEGFWPFARQSEATVVFLLGVMANFLLKRPPSASDRDHAVRTAFVVPLTDDAARFRERFGVDVYTIFNMTEISSPLVSVRNPDKRGTCGRPRPGVELRLVDAHDCEVPVGTVGEMILRTDRPFAMNSGYNGAPEATAAAWRNGWFHTGDAFRRDADGDYFFVDRVKDAIRRRGENISSFEVEIEVCAHPAVQEAAAIGVASAVGEDDVMIVAAAVAGASLDPVALYHFLVARLPYFMVPRYIRLLDALPKTPSAKVQKALLRNEGVTADSWDSEKAGLRSKREILSR